MLRDKSSVRVFVIVCVSFLICVICAWLQKPLNWFDEHTHYARAIELSRGDFMVRGEPSDSQVGGYINTGEYDLIRYANPVNGSYGFDTNFARYYGEIYRTDKDCFYAVTNTIPNHPIVYLPYIIAAWAAALFKLTPLCELYLMRALGLCFFFGVYVYALSRSRRAKLPMALLLLSPCVFLTLSSVTADAYTLSFSALFLVTLFEKDALLFEGASLTTRDFIEIAVTTVLMSFCKLPCFLLIGLWLVVLWRHRKLHDRRLRRWVLLSAGAAAVITLVFFLLVKDVNTGKYWARNSNTPEQLRHILSHPLSTLKMFIYQFLGHVVLFDIQTGYVRNTGWIAPFWVSFLFYAGLMLSAREKESGHFPDASLSRSAAVFDFFSLLCAGVYIVLTSLIIYLQFTGVGSGSIEGVQPRYFLPIWLLLLLTYVYHRRKTDVSSFGISLVLSLLPLPFFVLSQLK